MKVNKLLKSIISFVVIVTLMGSIFPFVNTSNAANLNDWLNDVRSYSARYGYNVNGSYEQRWLLYDTTGKYKDIYCIRSGDRQHSNYREVDMYTINSNSNQYFQKLFGGSWSRYNQFMWTAENMYLYGDSNPNKAAAFKNLVGASMPYESGNNIENELYHQLNGITGEIYTVARNYQLVKTIQNEALLSLVNQAYTRNVDRTNIYGNKFENGVNVGEALTGTVHDYANKVMTKLTTGKPEGYSTINRNSDYKNSVSLTQTVDAGANWAEGISGKFTVTNKYKSTISDIKVYVNGTEISNPTFVNLNGATVSKDNLKNLLKNNATDSAYEFRVKYDGHATSDKVKVKLDIDYGYLTNVTLLVPTEDTTNGKNNQFMINVSRNHKTDEVSVEQKQQADGNYDLVIKKVNSEDNSAISGVRFTINGTQTSATGSDGTVTAYSDVAIDQSNVGQTTQYTISEVSLPSGAKYFSLTDSLSVYVKTEYKNSAYVLSSVSFDSSSSVTTKEVTLDDGTRAKATIGINGNIITVTIPNKPIRFDLALTKKIVKVASYERDGYLLAERLKSIDQATINDNAGHTGARYMMNKSGVQVELGDVVKYRISVYNEGNVDGYAKEITDYLPSGLSLTPNDETNTTYGWVDNGDGTISTTYLADTLIKAYDGTNLENAYVEVSLTVANDVLGQKNIVELLNRSEISKYGYYDKNNNFVEANAAGIDIDSIQDSVPTNSSSSTGIIAEIKSMIDNVITRYKETNRFLNIQNVNKAFFEYEDDDDIERLIVTRDIRFFDLALRKWIIDVDGRDYSAERQPSIIYKNDFYSFEDPNSSLMANILSKGGTWDYDNPKDAIQLEPGSVVTYRIAVTNEGYMPGYADEITDYLPKGLEFVENDPTNSANGWVATKDESTGITTVKTTKFSKENSTSNVLYGPLYVYAQNQAGNMEPVDFRTVDIVCKVDLNIEDNTVLTNRAEITKYGRYDDANNYSYADTEGIDRDSVQDTIKDSLKLDTWYYENYDATNPKDFYPGVQDDDDFETVFVKTIKGQYDLRIKKVNSIDNTVIDGVTFKVNGTETAKTVDGIVTAVDNAKITKATLGTTAYTISEVNLPAGKGYAKVADDIIVYITTSEANGEYVVSSVSFDNNSSVTSKVVKLEDDSKVTLNVELTGNVITLTIPNRPTDFDLSLRKFITKVNDKDLETSREPKVDVSKLVSGESTTATYNHPKDAVKVHPNDIVDYTIRVYNEGSVDGYATLVMDDVPADVEMIAPEYTPDKTATNINAEYRWIMYREVSEGEDIANEETIKYAGKTYVITNDASNATVIVTDYLSKAYGDSIKKAGEENPNLLKAFDATVGKMTEANYRDVKVQFKVKAAKEDKEIINYAQITEDEDANGDSIKDRDSTPNEWIDGEDDQDIEKVKVGYFDLALYKWVSTALVTENGKTKEYASNHNQLDKSKMVDISIPKNKLKDVTVKFRYQIKVENQGSIEGYAKEIKDHIPAGLKFVEADNTAFGWKLQEDGTITTDYLKDTLLKPGETAEVTVVLTWINGSNNLGRKINYAEISKDYNDYGAPDRDSTPNNFKDVPKEDDEDGDVVMLQIKTGAKGVAYVVAGLASMVIIAAGAFGIKKFVM